MRQIKLLLTAAFVLVSAVFAYFYINYEYHRDRTPPRFYDEIEVFSVSAGADEAALCEGLRAYDAVDGELTDKIKVKQVSQLIGVNSAQVTYIVFDSSSNASTYTRTVYYTDYERPHFQLTAPLVYDVNETVTLIADGRLSAYDVVDGDISDKIRLSTLSLTNAVEGSYKIRVIVSNSLGDTAILPLTVTIRSRTASDSEILLSSYLLYTDGAQALDPMDYVQEIQDPTQGGAQPISEDTLQISADINYKVAGTYEIVYTYVSPSGSVATAILTVVVE